MADMDRPRVLVIEDDAALNEIVCTFLTQEGYACTPAFSGSEAHLVLAAAAPGPGGRPAFDLVVTDLMLPGMPGEELVPQVRERLGDVPVIVTSARSAVAARVSLLRTAADASLVQPFDLDELLARIEACLRRARPAAGGAAVPPAAAAAGALAAGRWALDPERRSFCVDGAPVRLTRTEFDIVRALMEQPDRVFTKRDLYRRVDHDGAAEPTLADEKTVTTHVGNLRAKLKASGTDSYVETVWGIGFKLHVA